MRRQHDEGLKYWFAPRENEKPFTESERAQRWRLSLASLLFITVLLSDHLWFCAEAKLTRTRDKRSDEGLAITDMGEYPNSLHQHPTSPDTNHLAREQDVIFLGNSTKPLWRMDTCHPDSLSKDCFTFTDARTVCLGLSGRGEKGTQLAYVNLSDLYLSFCNSYSLLDLFYGFTSPDDLNCTLDMAMGVDLLGCSKCVRAYQLIDKRAEDNYREFELLVQKYETDAYSVRTCMEECKIQGNSPSQELSVFVSPQAGDKVFQEGLENLYNTLIMKPKRLIIHIIIPVAPSNHLTTEKPFLVRDAGLKNLDVADLAALSALLDRVYFEAKLGNITTHDMEVPPDMNLCGSSAVCLSQCYIRCKGRQADLQKQDLVGLLQLPENDLKKYFQTTQMHCSKRIPCGQYCLEVQQRCPFVLPDNDDLIHGGSPSFICTGLLEDYPSGVDPNAECCDVRWDLKVDNRSRGTLKRTHPPCQHRTSLSSSAACRLCNSRLKLCLLVLVLLHTVASLTASQNATGLGLPAITPLEESPANEDTEALHWLLLESRNKNKSRVKSITFWLQHLHTVDLGQEDDKRTPT
ncbi:hypothetical protein FQN60_001233 [Etheostoma spectabile]|uniref:Uncharacterized protein n=1 Tax=Etheostoma spectabile TaxID=54343 RepID=A0A5J5D3D4_9PERO|nr:hypothetical protein FQN60_001233 [Etheostoma spectabile]